MYNVNKLESPSNGLFQKLSLCFHAIAATAAAAAGYVNVCFGGNYE